MAAFRRCDVSKQDLIVYVLPGKMVVMKLSITALIALAIAVALPGSARADDVGKCKLAEIAKLPVTMQGDRASIAVTINGSETRLWLDSGAFFNIMSKAKAVELGLHTESLPSWFLLLGIGGSSTAELTRISDFRIGGAQFHNMEFVVGGSDVGNGFLGANLLGVVDTEFDLAKSRVNLFKESGCSRVNLAYWANGMTLGVARLFNPERPNDHHIHVEVVVNGHSLHATLDTGAPTTLINRTAAERAGLNVTAPEVVASMKMSGFGSHPRPSWIVRAKSISIGGEEIQNSPIRVIENRGDSLDDDMLLGVDFLMSHHVLVSQSQRQMYLTYNGGPVFSVSTDGEIGHLETRAVNMGASERAVEPKTADEFAGRGTARLTRNDTTGAIADLSEAIRLAPTRTDLLTDRAKAYSRSGQPDLASKDIDAALLINPKDHVLLTRRAQVKLGKGDEAGALADTDAAAAATPKGSLDVVPVVVLYERLGKADRGLALLDPVVALHHDDSRYPMLLNARSWNRALANSDLDRALRDINTAIRKSDGNPEMLDTRALVQFRRKDYAAAMTDANAVLAKVPKLSASLYVRGLARLASGDEAGGKTDIAAARAISPKIDRYYGAYGLIAPKSETPVPVQPPKPDEDDDDQ